MDQLNNIGKSINYSNGIDLDIVNYQLQLFLKRDIKSAHKITKNIWLGNANTANDPKFIKMHNISAVFNVTDSQKTPNGIKSYVYEVKDNLRSNQLTKLYTYFNDITKKMKYHTDRDDNIIIYCRAGAQRSASSVAAYLMRYKNMSLDDSIHFIRTKRKIAFHFFPHFLTSLKKYEIDLNNDK